MNRTVMEFLIFCAILPAQTLVNGGRTVTGVWDASGAASTKPLKTGPALPANCMAGEMFFLTSASAGQNVYVCAAANSWARSGASAGLTGAGIANQVSYFSGPSSLASDDKITRDSNGNLTAVSFQTGYSHLDWYTVDAGYRLYFHVVDAAVCNAGSVTLTPNMSIHRVDLNNQPSCSINMPAVGDLGELAIIQLCQGAATPTTSISWSGVKAGLSAAGSAKQCAAQTFLFDTINSAWYATSGGTGWN